MLWLWNDEQDDSISFLATSESIFYTMNLNNSHTTKMNLICCNYKNYLQWSGNEFFDCLNILEGLFHFNFEYHIQYDHCVLSMGLKLRGLRRNQMSFTYWTSSFNISLILQTASSFSLESTVLKFILLEVVFVFSKELNCTSNCTYDHYICCIKLRK